MYLKKTPKWPVRKWLGRYSAYLAIHLKAKSWEQEEFSIERFLRCFPHYRSLEHFSSTDFADFCAVHPHVLHTPIRRFWGWLIEQKLPLYQIAIKCYVPKVRKNYNLNLDDMLHLLNECTSTELKRKIISAVKGESAHIPMHKIGLREELRNAASRVGLPSDFHLRYLKARVNKRLAHGLIENYCQQLLDTLPSESKLDSDTFRTI